MSISGKCCLLANAPRIASEELSRSLTTTIGGCTSFAAAAASSDVIADSSAAVGIVAWRNGIHPLNIASVDTPAIVRPLAETQRMYPPVPWPSTGRASIVQAVRIKIAAAIRAHTRATDFSLVAI